MVQEVEAPVDVLGEMLHEAEAHMGGEVGGGMADAVRDARRTEWLCSDRTMERSKYGKIITGLVRSLQAVAGVRLNGTEPRPMSDVPQGNLR